MLLRYLVVVGWMGLASLVVNVATAEDAVAPITSSSYAVDGVSFADPMSPSEFVSPFDLNFTDQHGPRFTQLTQTRTSGIADPDAMRRFEVALVARGARAGIPLDVAFAQRASMTVNENGDIEREGRGSELRLGRGLGNARRSASAAPSWYIFAASDDEALTWRPGVRNAFGGASSSFAVQDQVEIGDMQAGITYETGRIQASLAYVEREISVQTGARSFSEDESFTGLTLTMRH